jgi:DNA-binding NarL/FixJ family response regulator
MRGGLPGSAIARPGAQFYRGGIVASMRDAPADVRVLTVDDQEPFRRVAEDVIEATPGFTAVGEAASGREALEAVARLEPELVLLDVRMPDLDGIEVARRLAATHPDTLVVLISMSEVADLPSATQLAAAPLVRKQDFGPRMLRKLWSERSP